MTVKISTNKDAIDIDAVHEYISERSYWGEGRSRAKVEESICNSVCFSAFSNGEFAGFARVISDCVAMAYILDLFVLERFRGRGISLQLVETILDYEPFAGVTWMLATRDAHELYRRFGFECIDGSERYMKKAPENKKR